MKAIAVIDVPTRCDECPCCHTNENWYGDILSAECFLKYKYLNEKTFEKPDWCPLRMLPDKLNNADFLPADRLGDLCSLHYASGFNDCLNEIAGETEWK